MATKKLTNNTKGIRNAAGIKVLPGKSVEVTTDQEKKLKANPVAMAWIERGDLSLK